MKDKEIYPGKIMYSGFNGTVKPVQFLRHHESEVDIYYARFYYGGEGGGEFGGEFKCIGLNYLFDTREEAINYALSELGASIAKLPSVDELRDLEMSAQPTMVSAGAKSLYYPNEGAKDLEFLLNGA